MDANLNLRIDSKQAITADKALKDLERSGKQAETQFKSLERNSSQLGNALKGVAAIMGVVASANITRGLININSQFELMGKQLNVATGSARDAQIAFDSLNKLSTTMPLNVAELTEAFIKMKNLGLTPTAATLQSFANTAAANGKSLMQFTEAVADAVTGEFERLKEFGIKSAREGDKVVFTFRGLKTEIGNNATEINAFLKSIGENEFAGAATDQMDTYTGAVSNLGVAYDNLNVAFDQYAKITPRLTSLYKTLAEVLDDVAFSLGESNTNAKELNKSSDTLKQLLSVLAISAKGAWEALSSLAEAVQLVGTAATLVTTGNFALMGEMWDNYNAKIKANIDSFNAFKEAMLQGAPTANLEEVANQLDRIAATKDKTDSAAIALKELQDLMSRKWSEKAFIEQREEQKRVNELLAEATNHVADYGDTWTRTGNQALDAMGSMIASLAQVGKAEKKNAEMRAKLEKIGQKGSKEYIALEKQKVQISVKGSADMLSAASAMFKEGSKEQKAAHKAALAMHAITLAMELQKQIAAMTTATTVNTANTTMAITGATASVASSGTGDPYTAPLRVAAMAAMMAGVLANIGASFSGGGGGSSVAPSASGQELGALGGGGSKDTLANTQELLETNKDQFRTLQGIYDASWKTANSIENLLATAFKTGDMRGLTTPVGFTGKDSIGRFADTLKDIPLLGSGVSGIIGGLFGSKTRMTGARLEISGALEDTVIGGVQDYRRKGGLFRSSKRWSEEFDVSDDVQNSVLGVLENLGTQMSETAKLMGKDVESELRNMAVVIGSIDMTGKPEEVLERMNEAFGKQADYMAQTLFPELMKYQGYLESQAETATRVSSQKAITEELAATLGVTIGNTTEFSQVLHNLAGGFDEITKASLDFAEAFLTEEEKRANNTRQLYASLADELSKHDKVIPATREQYAALTKSFLAMGEAGAETYRALVLATDAANEYYKTLEEKSNDLLDAVRDAYARFADQSDKIKEGLLGLLGAEELLAYQREKQLEQIDPLLQEQQKRLWALQDEQKALVDVRKRSDDYRKSLSSVQSFLTGAFGTIRQYIVSLTATGAMALGSVYAADLESAKAGDRTALSGITSSAQSYLAEVTSKARSAEEVNRAKAGVVGDLSNLTQITPEEYLAKEITAALNAQTQTLDEALIKTLPEQLQAVVNATEYEFDGILNFVVNDASIPTDIRWALAESVSDFERTIVLLANTDEITGRTKQLILDDTLKSTATINALLEADTPQGLMDLVLKAENKSSALINAILADGVVTGIEDVILGKTLSASAIMDAALSTDIDDNTKMLITEASKTFKTQMQAVLDTDLSDDDSLMLLQGIDGIYRTVVTAATLGEVDGDAWKLVNEASDTITKTLAASKGEVNADAWKLVNEANETITKTLAASK
jgi:hypothetical protein